MESITYEPEHHNSDESAAHTRRKIGEKAMYARLLTNANQSSVNEAVGTLLTENSIPFVSAQVDVPEPELTVSTTTYYGIEQIRDNVTSIRRRIQD